MQKDVGIVQNRNLAIRIVDEVRRQIAAVELHAFHDFQFILQARTVFDGDHAFLADFFHGFGNFLSDHDVGICGDRANLGDFLAGGAGLGDLLQFFYDGDDGLVDATLQIHRIHAGSHELHAFLHDRLCQHGGSGGTVTGDIRGLGSHFLEHLGAHVFEPVLEFDFLGDRHAVLGNGGGAKGALQHHIAALRAQGHLDRVGQDVDSSHDAGTGGVVKFDVFCCHKNLLLK